MIYAISDLHGCFEKYKHMLDKIRFCDADTLYVLGDVVDRGDGGIQILKDMQERKNVIPLKGNHDYMAYRLLKMLTQPSDMYDADCLTDIYQAWLSDGGAPTYSAFTELPPSEQRHILAYMSAFRSCAEIKVGGNTFFLSHTVPEKEHMPTVDAPNRKEFITGEPEYEKQYFPDKYTVTGHTPTGLIDKAYVGRIYQKNRHIAIDCGAVFGNPLGCICLDTFEEFYTE